MSFFRKLGGAITGGFRKVGGAIESGAKEVGGAFRKGGNTIARGIGGLAGGSLGASLGSGLAIAIGQPELAPAFGAVGGIIGRTAGGEGASRIEQSTRGIASGKRPIFGSHNSGVARAVQSAPHSSAPQRVPPALHLPGMVMPQPLVPKLPSPAPRKPMVGRDGGGIYQGPPLSVGQKKQMMEKKRNELEKSRPQKKEDLFM